MDTYTQMLMGQMANKNNGGGQPSVDLAATENSQPVRLLQKFVNDRGWGAPIDNSQMYDWRGNQIGAQAQQTQQPQQAMNAEMWEALAGLLNRERIRQRGPIGGNHNGGGPGGRS